MSRSAVKTFRRPVPEALRARSWLTAALVAVLSAVLGPARPAVGAQPDDYPTAEGVRARLADLASSNPDICRAIDVTVRYGQEPTHHGQHIYALKVSARAGEDEDEPAVLFVAGHHGDEYVTVATALHGAELLVHGYGDDEAITSLLDTTEVWIAPLWNPDGYAAGTRVNGRGEGPDGRGGVDLNRNYPFGFGECGGSTDPDRATFQGPAAASEPETRTMIAFARDRRFAVVHDAHAGAFDLRFGYGCESGHPWRELYAEMARGIIDTTGLDLPPRSSCCLAGDIHLHMSTTLSVCFLWELGSKSAPIEDARAQSARVWRGVIPSFGESINVSGHVVDGETGAPISARIEAPGGGFEKGEHGTSNERFGRFDLALPQGAHELRFTAPGYAARTEVAVSRPGERCVLEVVLFSTGG